MNIEYVKTKLHRIKMEHVALRERERGTGCFTLIVFLASLCCLCNAPLPWGAIGCSLVCDCGISWSYSLAFLMG